MICGATSQATTRDGEAGDKKECETTGATEEVSKRRPPAVMVTAAAGHTADLRFRPRQDT